MTGERLLEATGVQLTGRARPFGFGLGGGEIVGLAGLDGHGQATFLEVLSGNATPFAGTVTAHTTGEPRPIRDAWDAYAQGIVYLPQDRKTEGIFPALSILDNFRMLTIGERTRLGFLSRGRALRDFAAHRTRLDIVMSAPSAAITSLSGGNQQKVLLARLLEAGPRVMLLNDPTRGVDYPTRLALFATFEELAATTGLAIVVLSTEIDEIVSHCHRAVVFREGRPSAFLDRGALNRETVLAGMFGLTGAVT